MKPLSTILFTCLFLLFQSCSTNKDCEVNCTEEYRSIVVKIKDSSGEPVVLDRFEVVDLRNDRDISLVLDDWTYQYQRERGIYPIFSDKYLEDYRQRQVQIKFTGFIEDVEIVSEVYRVGADCCHVYHVSGDLELVL